MEHILFTSPGDGTLVVCYVIIFMRFNGCKLKMLDIFSKSSYLPGTVRIKLSSKTIIINYASIFNTKTYKPHPCKKNKSNNLE